MPLWYLGQLLRSPGSQWLVMRYNLGLFTVLLIFLWVLLRNRLDRKLVRTFLLLLVSASLFGFATQDFLGEMFTAVLVGLGALMVFTGPRILGWLALAIGAANTPATALGLGLTVVDRVLKRRRLWFVGALVVFLTAVYFDLHFRGYGITHNPYANNSNGGVHTVMPYSGGVGFSYPVFFGLISILLSFGKGLFFFAPGLLIPARRVTRSEFGCVFRLSLVAGVPGRDGDDLRGLVGLVRRIYMGTQVFPARVPTSVAGPGNQAQIPSDAPPGSSGRLRGSGFVVLGRIQRDCLGGLRSGPLYGQQLRTRTSVLVRPRI
jgi:hypothetical protein